MILKLDTPLTPVAWQCVFQALQDYTGGERRRAEHVFETPDGDCTVTVAPHERITKATARIGGAVES